MMRSRSADFHDGPAIHSRRPDVWQQSTLRQDGKFPGKLWRLHVWNGHRPPFGEFGTVEGLQDRTASMCQSEVATQPLKERRPQMNATTYGLDIAKRVFQMYWVDAQTGEIANRK